MNGPSVPGVVAFDLGGVLVDVDKTRIVALGAQANAALFEGDLHQHFTLGLVNEEQWLTTVAGTLGRTVNQCDDVRRAWCHMVSWAAGGLPLLQEVAAVTTTRLWSNTDPLHWSTLKAAAPDVGCDTALSFQLGCAKPAARFFAAALPGLDPAAVLFLDDREQNIEAARRAGVDAVLCRGVSAARAILRERGVLP